MTISIWAEYMSTSEKEFFLRKFPDVRCKKIDTGPLHGWYGIYKTQEMENLK